MRTKKKNKKLTERDCWNLGYTDKEAARKCKISTESYKQWRITKKLFRIDEKELTEQFKQKIIIRDTVANPYRFCGSCRYWNPNIRIDICKECEAKQVSKNINRPLWTSGELG